jgi:hypothetical protein
MADETSPSPDASSEVPKWSEVTAAPWFDSASPEQKLVSFDRWHNDAYNHASQQPEWQDPAQQDGFNNWAAQTQSELSKTAGGLTPDEARVKIGQTAVNTAQGYATLAESTRDPKEIERDALRSVHPDIVSAYYNNKATTGMPSLANIPATLNIPEGSPEEQAKGRVPEQISAAPTIGEGYKEGGLVGAAMSAQDILMRHMPLGSLPDKLGMETQRAEEFSKSIYGEAHPFGHYDITAQESPGTVKAKSYFNAASDLLGSLASPQNLALLVAAGGLSLPSATARPLQDLLLKTSEKLVGVGFADQTLVSAGDTIHQAQKMPDGPEKTQLLAQGIVQLIGGGAIVGGVGASIKGAAEPEAMRALSSAHEELNKGQEHPVVQAAKEAAAPKTAAEIAPVIKETEHAATSAAEQTPDIHIRKGNLVAPAGTTVEHLRDFWKAIPAEERTPELLAQIKARLKQDAAKAPETLVGPSLAGEIGKLGDTHANLLEQASKGPYAGVALEAFGNDQRHTFRTTKGRDVSRREAFQIAKAEQERTGQQILKPGVIEAVTNGDRPAELRSDDLLPRPEAKAEAPMAGGFPLSAANLFTGTAEQAAHAAPELLKEPLKKLGASFVRATDADGRKSVVSIADLDTIKGAGPFTKIEAGTKSKGKFLPIDQPITIREAAQPKAELAKPRPIPAWMLKDEEESKLGKGDIAREMKGRGRTPEQKELQIKVGTEHATTKALSQGYPDSYDELHKFTGDSTAASKLHEELEAQLAKEYPPQKIPTDAKVVMQQHKETGIKYPTAELPTGEKDAKGKPITKMGTPFTNDPLKVAAAFDDGKPQIVPQSLLTAEKVNPAIMYDEATGNVTGVQTKYGFVEKPGDLAKLYDNYTKVIHPQKAWSLVHGEKALAAAEGRAGRETGEEDIHELPTAPGQFGALTGNEEAIPQGKTLTSEELLAQADAEDQAEERSRYNNIMEEADRLGIKEPIIHDDAPPPVNSKEMPAAPKPEETSEKAWAAKMVDHAKETLQILQKAGVYRPDGRMSPNPMGAFIRWASTSEEVPAWANFFAKKILDSDVQLGNLKLQIIDKASGASGEYAPNSDYKGATLKLNLATRGYSGPVGTAIHEVFHHILEPLLAAKRAGEALGPVRENALQNLLDMREYATRQALRQMFRTEPTDADVKDFQKAQLPSAQYDPKTNKFVNTVREKLKYETHPILSFFGDVSEVIKAFSDEPTMEMLASMKPDPRFPRAPGKLASLLHQIVSSIKSLFFNEPETKEDTLWAQMTNEMLTLMKKPYDEGKQIRAGPDAMKPESRAKKVSGFDWQALAESIAGKSDKTQGERIIRPVVVDSDGKTVLTPNSKFGDSHATAAQEAFTSAPQEAKEKIISALGSGEQNKFETSTGRIVDRTEAAGIAKAAGQVPPDSGPRLYTDVLNDRTKFEAAQPQEKPGGEVIPIVRASGVTHELEIDPKASLNQLTALEKEIVSSKASPEDKGKMQAQLLAAIEKKYPFASQIAAPQAQAAHAAPTGIIGSLKEEIPGWWNRVKTTVQAAANKTFPRTTLVDQKSGELMARWIASPTAAPYLSNRFIAHILEGTELDIEKYGTALTEDNLRSVAANFKAKGDERAANVGSLIGQKGSPFKTEKEYQDFLKDSITQQAIARHIEMWNQTVDPMYKQAQLIDPDIELASRGLQTGARVNLFAVKEGEKNGISSAPGNLRATLQRKSPFGRQAKGTGIYNTNYADMMANTFSRQLEIANKNEFEKQLVASGNAIIGKPGEAPVLEDGEVTQGFPLRTRTLVTEKGAIPLNQNLYVRKSLAAEYLRASNATPRDFPPIVSAVTGGLNKAALAGFTDFTVHGSNLFTALTTRPSVSGGLLADTLLSMTGRADVLVTLGKLIIKSMKDNENQLGQLAEIGALRDYGAAGKSKANPLMWSGKALNWMDKTTRLMLDDAYKSMVASNLVENSETARREFVNQVGQYNRRAQNAVLRLARDTGIGPFATAGTTFNALGVRTATMSPGIKASSNMAAAALRINVLSKWAGAFVLVGALNYAIVGKMVGRPGVPIGNVDTGRNDKNNRPLSVPVFDLLGLGRALRVTGIKGGMEAYRKGLSNADISNSAIRDIYNAQISPFAGPVIRFTGAVANVTPFMGMPKPSPVVAPGENQFTSNVVNAVVNANPVAGSIRELRRGAGLTSAVEKQFPRFVPKATQPLEMMAKYPEIVRKAQASAFVDDVAHQARYMEPAERSKFVRDSLNRLHNSEDRKRAETTLKYRRIQY